MEKKSNWGGPRPNSGRPKKQDEQELINLLDKHIDRDLVARKLLEKVLQGDMKAIQLYMNYVYGRPKETIDQTTNLQINSVDISRMISFDRPNLLPLPEDLNEESDD